MESGENCSPILINKIFSRKYFHEQECIIYNHQLRIKQMCFQVEIALLYEQSWDMLGHGIM